MRINQLKEGKTWTRLANCELVEVTPPLLLVGIFVESDRNGILYLGTEKKHMDSEYMGSYLTGMYTWLIFDIVNDTRYYFYIANTIAGEVARTGIYTFKTPK